MNDVVVTLDDLTVSNREIMAGHRVFRGTTVAVEVVFENLVDGISLDGIVDQYSTLDRANVVLVVELTSDALAYPRAA
jgi:uncharacterized protein (DUF433 family)